MNKDLKLASGALDKFVWQVMRLPQSATLISSVSKFSRSILMLVESTFGEIMNQHRSEGYLENSCEIGYSKLCNDFLRKSDSSLSLKNNQSPRNYDGSNKGGQGINGPGSPSEIFQHGSFGGEFHLEELELISAPNLQSSSIVRDESIHCESINRCDNTQDQIGKLTKEGFDFSSDFQLRESFSPPKTNGYYEDGLVEFEMLETGKVKVTKIKDSTLSNYKIGGCFSDVKFLHDRQEILAYDASRQLLFLVKSDSEISIITDDIIYNAPSNRQIRIHNDLVFVITRFNAIVVYKAFLREPFRIICEIQGIPVALSSDGFLSYYSYDNKRGDLVTVKRMLLEESESMNALALNSQHNIICAISTQRDDILPQSTNIMVYLFKYDHEDNYFAKTKEKMFRVDLHLSLKPEDIDIDLGQTLNNEVVLFLLLKKKPSTGLGMILSEDTIKQYCQMRLQNRAQAFVFEGSDMWILDKRGTINKFN